MSLDLDTRRAWATYVELLQIAMGLRDWSIRIAPDVADEDYDAQVQWTFGTRQATLRVSAALVDEPARRVREVIVHELLHLHHAAADHLAEQALRQFGPYAFDGWEAMMECAIDATARAWAPTLPLPLKALHGDTSDADAVWAHP